MPRREALTSLRGIYIFNSVDHANLGDDRLLIRRDGAVIVRVSARLPCRPQYYP